MCVFVCVCVCVSVCVCVWPDMHVFWTHVCVDCVMYAMIQYTYLWHMYDPNSVLGRGLPLRESQQTHKKRKTDTGVSTHPVQPAVQNTKKKNTRRRAYSEGRDAGTASEHPGF